MSLHAARDARSEGSAEATVPDEPMSGVQLRRPRDHTRKRAVRARSIRVVRIAQRDLEAGRQAYPPEEHADIERPRTRADCERFAGAGPCPFVSCAHHLYLDVSPRTGSVKLNFPDLEPHELEVSCALDVAREGGVSMQRVGDLMNLSRTRVQQIEAAALAKLGARDDVRQEHDGFARRVRLPVLRDDAPHAPQPRPGARARVVQDDHAAREREAFDVERFAGDELGTE